MANVNVQWLHCKCNQPEKVAVVADLHILAMHCRPWERSALSESPSGSEIKYFFLGIFSESEDKVEGENGARCGKAASKGSAIN